MDKSEQNKLVSLLSQLEPGLLPYEIFKQLARLTALSIIEFVPLQRVNGATEVLLLERDKEDDIWPGEIHTPGTVIRPTDTEGEIYKAFERIRKDELNGTEISDGHFVGTLLHKSKRGTEHAQIFWVEVLGETKAGKFYRFDRLPENLIKSQVSFIAQAVKSFEQAKA